MSLDDKCWPVGTLVTLSPEGLRHFSRFDMEKDYCGVWRVEMTQFEFVDNHLAIIRNSGWMPAHKIWWFKVYEDEELWEDVELTPFVTIKVKKT